MGYRKDIRQLRKRIQMFAAELRAAERGQHWTRVAYLAGEINAIAWDLKCAAESKRISEGG